MNEKKIREGCKLAILDVYSEAQQRNMVLTAHMFTSEQIKHAQGVIQLCVERCGALIEAGATEWSLSPELVAYIAEKP
jgi:hypothetical protein